MVKYNDSRPDHSEAAVDKEHKAEPVENSERNLSPEKSAYPPNDRVQVDGVYYRTDDNGKIHMYRDDNDKLYKLVPHTEYTVNGYDYKTDDKGRISQVQGTLRITDAQRGPLNARVEDMEEGDERGHIISAKNDGSDRIDNLVPMTKELNDGAYKSFEKSLNDLVKEGHSVDATYKLLYNDGNDTKRPDAFAVTYRVDGKEGETYCRVFDNTAREED